MKLSHFILLFILTLYSCKQDKVEPILNQELANHLEYAESLRFTHPEVLDTILNNVLDDLMTENSDELWAKYYFVKAHVEESKSHFSSSILLLDSAMNHGLYEDEKYEARVILLEAIINEQLLLFEDARNYYHQLCQKDMACYLTPSEQLIVVLGKARIGKRLHLPINKYLENAEELISDETNMNLGLYYSNLAFFSKDRVEKIKYGKLSLNYYIEKELPLKVFNCYYNLANDYVSVNLDSSLYYMQQAAGINSDSSLVHLISNTRLQNYYFYYYAIVLFRMGNYDKAIEYINLALPISESLELENSLYGLKGIKSDILFIQGHYQASKDLAEESYDHHYTYKLKASENKIKYIEAKSHIDEVLQENALYELNQDNARLSIRLYILYSVIITIVLVFLFFRGKKIKSDLRLSYERIYKKDKSIFSLEDKLANINTHIEAKHFPEKVVLTNIDKAIKAEMSISSWDSFCHLYLHKFPSYDVRIKKCFPQLKKKELQYAMCVHFGLSDERTANIFNVQQATIRKKRQRLRQVLNLSSRDDIKDYLSNALTKYPNKH